MKVNIFDRYDDNTKKLIQSLETADLNRKNLFVHYDGTLPEEAISPFTYFTGQSTDNTGGLFFNQVKVPEFYAIRHVDGGGANIEHLQRAVGKIYYRKEGYRLVDHVDWFLYFNDYKSVIRRDNYSQSGQHYSSTYFGLNGPLKTEYYNLKGEKVIVEDLVQRSLYLHSKKNTFHFENLTQFFLYFLKTIGFEISDIYINSLSYPLFISRALEIGNQTTLFWQEDIGTEVPGNMKNELVSPKALKHIIFMKEKQLEQVKASFPKSPVRLDYLSYIGEFKRKNQFRKRAFILTNSDNIYGLRDILSNFPELQITVAAFTNMSVKLLHMEEEFNNIRLIPSINEEVLCQELEKGDIYLDINHGLKVGNILTQAYQEQMLIFSYKVVTQRGTKGLIFEDIQALCNHLSYILTDRTNWNKLLTKMIETDGKQSKIQDYHTVLEDL